MTEKFGNGVFIQLTDPSAFEDKDEFIDRVEAYKTYIKDSPTQEGVEAILLPGEPELNAEKARTETGIQLDEGTLKQLNALAKELEISNRLA